MHDQLRMSQYADTANATRERRNISEADVSLFSLEGKSMLSKLSTWFDAFFEDNEYLSVTCTKGEGISITCAKEEGADAPVNGADERLFLHKVELFYLFTLLLWTPTDHYTDIMTLVCWLDKTESGVLSHHLLSEVFDKVPTGEAEDLVAFYAGVIKAWVAAQKSRALELTTGAHACPKVRWYQNVLEELPQEQHVPVCAALQLITKLCGYADRIDSPLPALLDNLVARGVDSTKWVKILSVVENGFRSSPSWPSPPFPEWLRQDLAEFHAVMRGSDSGAADAGSHAPAPEKRPAPVAIADCARSDIRDCAGLLVESWCLADRGAGEAVQYHEMCVYAPEPRLFSVYTSLEFERAHLNECMRHFFHCRRTWPLPVGLDLHNWPSPMPFVKDAPDGELYASGDLLNMSHKRSAIAQINLIELGGALQWMDQLFHPHSSWSKYIQALIVRNRHFVRSEKRPRTSSCAYRRAVAQIRACTEAARSNDHVAFRANMGVFCERVFADEPSSHDLTSQNSLSTHLFQMLSLQTLMKLPLPHQEDDVEVDRRVGLEALKKHDHVLTPWFLIIQELSLKADRIAVLVVDALCNNIARSVRADIADFVFDKACEPSERKMQSVIFTDTTAPMHWTGYWLRKPTRVNARLEAFSRFMNYATPRARYPDTPYAKSLAHTVDMYAIFLKAKGIDTTRAIDNDAWFGYASGLPRSGDGPSPTLRKLLMNSINTSHFYDWDTPTITFAACAMLKYARSEREVVCSIRKEATRDLSECDVARLRSAEIYGNLDQAELMLEFLVAEFAVFGAKDPPRKESTGMERVYLREIKNVRKHWKAEDLKYSKSFASRARERRKAVAAVVSRCAKRACDTVLLLAQIADEEKKLRESTEKLRQGEEKIAREKRRIAARERIAHILSRAPRFAKRRADAIARAMDDRARVAMEAEEARTRHEARARGLAIAIERNRAAVKLREKALAKRAKVEQRALAQERRDAAKARSQAYKAEQAERQARIQAEVEAAERARREREAKAAAAAAEAARAAALAAEAERVRAVEEQRRRDADARLAAELQQKEKAAVLAAEAERARRAEQSRVERLVSQHAKELARARFAKAFALWRARARATHTAQSLLKTRQALAESRRAEQERCNAIFREGLKEVEATKAANKAKVDREREARRRMDKAREEAAAMVAKPKPAKAPAAAAASPQSPSPSSPETVTTCSPGPASPEPPAAAPAAVQPPLPKEPPPRRPPHVYQRDEKDVQDAGSKRWNGSAQWDVDYREALSFATMTSQNEWLNETGWATNRSAWLSMGGHALVMQQQLAQQQRDQHTATFHANCKHMARVRAEAHTALKKRLAERWTAQLNKEAQLVAALEYEELRLRDLEVEIAEMEKTREERRTRYAVLREYLDGLEAATEEERRELSAKRCEQIRNRTGTYDASLGVNECVFCFEKLCDHIATPCNHVVGCESCTIKHRNAKGAECPICRDPATFEKMHLP